jgi:hypothetical protein
MNSFIDLMNCERVRLSIILDELCENESLKITDLGHNKETNNIWVAVEQWDGNNDYKVVLFVSEVQGEAYKVRYMKTDDETGKETIYESYDEWKDYRNAHICLSCGVEMNDSCFKYGSMCCDKPLFHNDKEDEEDEEDEDNYFDRKYPDAKCHSCETPVSGSDVVYCGGGGGACETWYCFDCSIRTDCLVCASDKEEELTELEKQIFKRDDDFEQWRKSLTPQEERVILMDGYRKYLKTIE